MHDAATDGQTYGQRTDGQTDMHILAGPTFSESIQKIYDKICKIKKFKPKHNHQTFPQFWCGKESLKREVAHCHNKVDITMKWQEELKLS